MIRAMTNHPKNRTRKPRASGDDPDQHDDEPVRLL